MKNLYICEGLMGSTDDWKQTLTNPTDIIKWMMRSPSIGMKLCPQDGNQIVNH